MALAATDADGDDLTYAVTGGSLPAGVALRPDGSLTGSPTERGSSTVTDPDGLTDTTDLTVTVPDSAPVFTATGVGTPAHGTVQVCLLVFVNSRSYVSR